MLGHFTVNTSKTNNGCLIQLVFHQPQNCRLLVLSYCTGDKMTHLCMNTIVVGLPSVPLFMLILWSPLLHPVAYIMYHKEKFNDLFEKNHREFSSNPDVPISPTVAVDSPFVCRTTVINSSHCSKQIQPSAKSQQLWIEINFFTHTSQMKSYSLAILLTAFPKWSFVF